MLEKLENAFWKLVHHFIVRQNYRVLQLSENQNEIWLESLDGKSTELIRILKHNLDWGNWMQRDMERTVLNAERVRKKLYKKNVNALNIYVTEYPPVDEWESRLQTPLAAGPKNNSVLKSVMVSSNRMEEAFQEISGITRSDVQYEEKALLPDAHEKLKYEALAEAADRIERERKMFTAGRPFFTYLFLFLQIAMFVLLELNGGSTNTKTLIQFGAKYTPLILEGEWWRFFTPIALHIGFFHLLMNSMALYYLGRDIESIYGNVRFLFIYLFAGFAGTLASFLISDSLSAGASGAIFGCFGALLFIGAVNRSLFFRTMGMNVIGVIIINLVFGFIVPGIDNAGHIGGLAGGFLAAGIVGFPKQRLAGRQGLFLLGTLLLTGALLFMGFSRTPSGDPQMAALLGQDYINDGKIDKAHEVLSEASESDDAPAELFFLLSYTEIKRGELQEAEENLKKAVDMKPEFHEARYNLALVYMDKGEHEKALEQVSEAAKLKPDTKKYKELEKELRTGLGFD